MPTLYEIESDLQALADILSEVGGDVSDEEAEAAVDAWLAEGKEALAEKVDRYVSVIRESEAKALVLKGEADLFAARSKSNANVAAKLKDRLKFFLESHQMESVEGKRFKVRLQANGGKAPLTVAPEVESDPSTLPAGLYKLVATLDKEAIRAALESGATVNGCAIGERGKNVRIS